MEWIRSDLKERAVTGSPMTDDTEADHPAWVRIKQMHDRGDFDKIDRMVTIFDGLEALGSIGSILGKFLAWCAAIGGAYLAVTGQLADWIRSIR